MMAQKSVLDQIKHYQRDIDKCPENSERMLRCIQRLFVLPVTVQHLQETGIGRSVNALRKNGGKVAEAAKALILKWKAMVAAEDSSEAEPEEQPTSPVVEEVKNHKHHSDKRPREKESTHQNGKERDLKNRNHKISNHHKLSSDRSSNHREDKRHSSTDKHSKRKEHVGHRSSDKRKDEQHHRHSKNSHSSSRYSTGDKRHTVSESEDEQAQARSKRLKRTSSSDNEDDENGSTSGVEQDVEKEEETNEEDETEDDDDEDDDDDDDDEEDERAIYGNPYLENFIKKEPRSSESEDEEVPPNYQDESENDDNESDVETDRRSIADSYEEDKQNSPHSRLSGESSEDDEQSRYSSHSKHRNSDTDSYNSKPHFKKTLQKSNDKHEKHISSSSSMEKQNSHHKTSSSSTERKRDEKSDKRSSSHKDIKEEKYKKDVNNHKEMKHKTSASGVKEEKIKPESFHSKIKKHSSEHKSGTSHKENKGQNYTTHRSDHKKSEKEDEKPKKDHDQKSKTDIKKESKKHHREASSSSTSTKVSSNSVKKSSDVKLKNDGVAKVKIKMEKMSEDEDGIDGGSGASFADALMGMSESVRKSSKKKSLSSSSPKKKSEINTAESSKTKHSSILQSKDVSSTSSSSKNKSFDYSSQLHNFESEMLPKKIKLEPLDIDLASTLPEITPNYHPLPHYSPPDNGHSKISRSMTQEEALNSIMSTKNQRTKVFSGNRCYLNTVPTLFSVCIQVLQENIDALEYTGGVPYDLLKPILERATAEQLYQLEHYNPYLMEDTDCHWKYHCNKMFHGKKREEMESWRDLYLRCLDERERKLKALTQNITQSIKQSTPVRKTKLAYVDSFVKPPRNVAKQQAKFGTSAAVKHDIITKGMVGLQSGTPTTTRVPQPPAVVSRQNPSTSALLKKKKAPQMQKVLQQLKGNRFKR